MVAGSIGPYDVVERLGAGGMGEVYLARDTRLNRQVALKVLSDPALDIPAARQRLLGEAAAAARLSHPNIAAIHDILDRHEPPCIIMEYVAGENLASRVARGPVPCAQALAIAVQLADALGHAHAAGVVHRDLKPANVIVTPEGVAKILDFGVARVCEVGPESGTLDAATRTQAGVLTGTPAYMAPEQLAGKAATPASDLYALGVLLFELLTGRRPFVGADFLALALAIVNGPPPAARDINPDVPPHVSALVARAIATDPGDRFRSAGDFQSALRHAQRQMEDLPTMDAPGGIPTGTRDATSVATSTRHGVRALVALPSRHRRIAVLAILVMAASVAVFWLTVIRVAASTPVVAILPLVNVTGDQTKDYVGVGVAESLVSSLAHLKSLTVVSRNETRGYQGGRRDPAAAGRDLGATYLVDGAVQQAGAYVRFSVKLVKPDGKVVSSGDYHGTNAELFQLQQEAAEDLTRALGIKVSETERQRVQRPPAANVEAWADYSIGRALLDRSDLAGNIDKAIGAFEQATSRDSRFALAFAAIAEAHAQQYTNSNDASRVPLALAAIGRAIALAPDEHKVRVTRARILLGTGRYEEAIADLRAAIKSQPNDDEAHRLLARALGDSGRTDEAVEEFRQAIAVRPNYLMNHVQLGNFLYAKGRFDEAEASYRRITEIQPDSPLGFLNLGARLIESRNYRAALENLQRVVNMAPRNDQAWSNIGVVHYMEGRFDEAGRAFERAVQLGPQNATNRRNLGDLYARVGQADKARAEYQAAADLTGDLLKVNAVNGQLQADHALYSAKAGHCADAIVHAEQATALAASAPGVLYRRTVVHALCNQPNDAVKWLGQAIANGYSRSYARGDDDLAAIRKMPAVEALLREEEKQPNK